MTETQRRAVAVGAKYDQMEVALRDAEQCDESERLELTNLIYAGRFMAELAYAIDVAVQRMKHKAEARRSSPT